MSCVATGSGYSSSSRGGRADVRDVQQACSEVIVEFAHGLERGEIKIYEGCPFRNDLTNEAMAHNHKVTDRKLAVESKDAVKKRPVY
jgi:hypothetical protein